MTARARSLAVLAAAAGLWAIAACLDVSSPVSGVLSISFLKSATPSVVRGDSLRDTAGVPQPLEVDAFGANGAKLSDVVVRYYVIDTTRHLHVDSLTGFVWGDSNVVSPNGAIFARVRPANGKGFLDTPLDTIPIVPTPDSITRDTNFTFVFDAATPDTASSALITPAFGVTVRGAADTVIPKYVVVFDTVRVPAPRSASAGPSVVLTSAVSAAESTLAVTDGSGHAALRLRLRIAALPATLLSPGGVDTAVIRFRVRYYDRLQKKTILLPASQQSDTIIITLKSK